MMENTIEKLKEKGIFERICFSTFAAVDDFEEPIDEKEVKKAIKTILHKEIFDSFELKSEFFNDALNIITEKVYEETKIAHKEHKEEYLQEKSDITIIFKLLGIEV